MKQLLPDFLSHPWVVCKEPADGADGRAGNVRKTGDQLEAEPLPLSKIRDRSTEGNGRPHRTAVFDF